MIERFKSRPTLAALAAAAITALGVGGVAVAQSGGGSADQLAQKQSAPEQQGAPENSAADRDNVQDENGKDDAGEASEKADGAEQGSEKAEDDGPGGHADEPGNPNAEHEVQGEE
jgi:hypothetical protein